MVANMKRIENAARLAMADFGADVSGAVVEPAMASTTRLGLVVVSVTMASLIVIAFL